MLSNAFKLAQYNSIDGASKENICRSMNLGQKLILSAMNRTYPYLMQCMQELM